jgi:hypothetical protein
MKYFDYEQRRISAILNPETVTQDLSIECNPITHYKPDIALIEYLNKMSVKD